MAKANNKKKFVERNEKFRRPPEVFSDIGKGYKRMAQTFRDIGHIKLKLVALEYDKMSVMYRTAAEDMERHEKNLQKTRA